MSTTVPIVIVGLTGGIASGKSTVSALFEKLGAYIIDADKLARTVVQPGQPALEELRQAFGPHVFHDDATLNREALGARIFKNTDDRQKLNEIMHPRIAHAMMQQANLAREQGYRWVIYDAALIVENNLHHLLDSLIVVATDTDRQRERLMARNHLSANEAQSRIDAQMPLDAKIAVADYVIDNNLSLHETDLQVRAIFNQINERVQKTGSAKPDA